MNREHYLWLYRCIGVRSEFMHYAVHRGAVSVSEATTITKVQK